MPWSVSSRVSRRVVFVEAWSLPPPPPPQVDPHQELQGAEQGQEGQHGWFHQPGDGAEEVLQPLVPHQAAGRHARRQQGPLWGEGRGVVWVDGDGGGGPTSTCEEEWKADSVVWELGACPGACEGKWEADPVVWELGTCPGTCDGKWEADSVVWELGTCPGTCEGKWEADPAVWELGTCLGTCEGKWEADPVGQAADEAAGVGPSRPHLLPDGEDAGHPRWVHAVPPIPIPGENSPYSPLPQPTSFSHFIPPTTPSSSPFTFRHWRCAQVLRSVESDSRYSRNIFRQLTGANGY